MEWLKVRTYLVKKSIAFLIAFYIAGFYEYWLGLGDGFFDPAFHFAGVIGLVAVS